MVVLYPECRMDLPPEVLARVGERGHECPVFRVRCTSPKRETKNAAELFFTAVSKERHHLNYETFNNPLAPLNTDIIASAMQTES